MKLLIKMRCRKGKLIMSVFGVALLLVMYLDSSNNCITVAQLQPTTKYESGFTPLQFNRTLLNKYLTKRGQTIWNEHITRENNSLRYKGGRTLTEATLGNKKVTKCNRQNFLVYKCDSSTFCGGWGDRQKGIVSTFLLALLTNRTFLIDIDIPCKLESALLPNIYDWSACKAFVKTVSAKNVIQFNYIDNTAKVKAIKDFNFNKKWLAKVVVSRFNSYAINEIRQHKLAKSRLKWLLNISNEEAIHLVLHTLFEPTHKTLDDASRFYETQVKGKPLVCGHIRIGKNPSVPSDINLRYGVPNITMILDFLKMFEVVGTNAIYIASDSEHVKELARRSIKSYIYINRTIVHVDRLGRFKKLKSDACEGWKTVVLEQFILSLCDILVLTRSGFGTMAAYTRGVRKDILMFHPIKRTIVETNWTGLQNAFNFL